MTNYKAIIRDGLILMVISTVFALVFKVGFDQLRGTVEDDPLITASLQDNIDMMMSIIGEESFKKNSQGKDTYEEFAKFMTNKQDEQKRTPLMWVAYMNFSNRETIKNKEDKRLVAAKLLLERGADIKLKDEHGWTALSWAAWTGLPTLVDLFVEKNADIDVADVKGQTPLIISSIRGNDEVVKLLLEKGADREIKNNDGKTALDFAQEYMNRYPDRKSNYETIIKLLNSPVKSQETEPVEEESTEKPTEDPAEKVPEEETAE
jgi:ankyrin repeat protein